MTKTWSRCRCLPACSTGMDQEVRRSQRAFWPPSELWTLSIHLMVSRIESICPAKHYKYYFISFFFCMQLYFCPCTTNIDIHSHFPRIRARDVPGGGPGIPEPGPESSFWPGLAPAGAGLPASGPAPGGHGDFCSGWLAGTLLKAGSCPVLGLPAGSGPVRWDSPAALDELELCLTGISHWCRHHQFWLNCNIKTHTNLYLKRHICINVVTWIDLVNYSGDLVEFLHFLKLFYVKASVFAIK